MNDNLFLSKVDYANWFWGLYEFTDMSQFWDRGIIMSKNRSFWLHETVDILTVTRFPYKYFLDVFKSFSYLKFLYRNVRYWSAIRKYVYSLDIFHLCSAGAFHVQNMSSKRLLSFDIMDKLGCKYLFYNYVFSKKINYKKYKNMRPTFSVSKGSDLLLTTVTSADNIDPQLVVDALFVDKNYISFAHTIVSEDTHTLNFSFIFDLSVLNIVELYRSMIFIFFLKLCSN